MFELKVDKRKLQKVGRSYMITIPKEWVEHHGYDVGSEVYFVTDGGDIHYLSPEKVKQIYKIIKKGGRKK